MEAVEEVAAEAVVVAEEALISLNPMNSIRQLNPLLTTISILHLHAINKTVAA